ncbi:MAG: hypothetical protein SWK76_17015 [Actinomycetota bacterium]|nr:hypothetical protein [Actinomycetota bacterium]
MIRMRVDQDDVRDLRSTAAKLGVEFEDFMRWVAERGAEKAGGLAPHRSGETASSINGGVEGSGASVEAYVKSDLFYAYFENYGYKLHFVPWEMSSYGDGPGIGFYAVKAGNPDGYFIEPGLEEALKIAGSRLNAIVEKI